MSEEKENLEMELEQEPKQEAVDLAAYERMKNDMHKFKRQSVELAKERAEFETKLQLAEEEKLKGSQNYKELWEKERESKQTILGDFNSLKQNLISDKKMSAIKAHAAKLGLDDDFVDMLDAFDTSDVLVETTSSGQFIVNGADTWVEALKADKPKMFKQKVDPTINNASGGYDGREKTYTTAEILHLQKTDQGKYQEVMSKITRNKKLLITR